MQNGKNMDQYTRMTETPVAPLLIRLAIPTTISMLVTSIYNMADAAFVGQLGNAASGAIGIVFGYMAILQSVAFMFGQGSGSIIARLLGKKRAKDASRYASTAFFTALGVSLVIAVVSLLLLEPMLRLLGSTETILPHAKQYCRFIILGAPFIMGGYVMNNILRYEGLAAKAMRGLVSGAVLNIVLDPVLIFGFGMGTAGAGLATALSQMVSFSILLSMFLRRITQSRISIRYYTRDIRDVWEIMTVGAPSLLRQSLGSLATIVLNNCAGVWGDVAISAMAITNRVAMFLFSFGLGLGQGYQPICSFNYGAEKYDRVRTAYKTAMKMAMGLMIVAGTVVFIMAPQIVRLFRDDPDVIAIGTRAMRYASIALVTQPLSVLTNMTLQSSGKALPASVLSMMRSGIYFIPLVLILSRTIGLPGIEIAQPVADVLTAATSIPFLLWYFRRLPKGE